MENFQIRLALQRMLQTLSKKATYHISTSIKSTPSEWKGLHVWPELMKQNCNEMFQDIICNNFSLEHKSWTMGAKCTMNYIKLRIFCTPKAIIDKMKSNLLQKRETNFKLHMWQRNPKYMRNFNKTSDNQKYRQLILIDIYKQKK